MIEKPEPIHPVKPPQTPEERKHWGELKPIRYPDSLGKRLGNWLYGLLTPWKR